jgi:phage/plasmid-like protein (TIGR03299 family)
MSAEITIRADGKAEFAYAGQPAWHGLGNQLTENAPVEDWVVEAGLTWEVFQSAVQYTSMEGQHIFDDKRVLFRSDTKEALSIVGKDYKIVQPIEVLEFFRDLTTLHGMKLSAAGSLFGGRRFWATAEIGKSFEAVSKDHVNGYLLLVTSVDGTLATTAKLTSTRTVCNNTLTVALNDNSKRVVKKSHRVEWDAAQVKMDMGLIDESWEKFSASIKKLAEVEVSDKFVTDYFQKKFYMDGVLAEDQPTGRIKEVAALLDRYKSGAGANYSNGTAWGVVNAATDLFTHGNGRKRDQSHAFWQSHFGRAEKIKNEVLADMLALTA